jgi:hypothetical protein
MHTLSRRAHTPYVNFHLVSGQNLLAEPSIVNYLENIRRAFIHANGKAVDLLRDTLKSVSNSQDLVLHATSHMFFMQHHDNSNVLPRMCRTGSNAALVSRGGGRERGRERERGLEITDVCVFWKGLSLR